MKKDTQDMPPFNTRLVFPLGLLVRVAYACGLRKGREQGKVVNGIPKWEIPRKERGGREAQDG